VFAANGSELCHGAIAYRRCTSIVRTANPVVGYSSWTSRLCILHPSSVHPTLLLAALGLRLKGTCDANAPVRHVAGVTLTPSPSHTHSSLPAKEIAQSHTPRRPIEQSSIAPYPKQHLQYHIKRIANHIAPAPVYHLQPHQAQALAVSFLTASKQLAVYLTATRPSKWR
jgi:hypothetical protein